MFTVKDYFRIEDKCTIFARAFSISVAFSGYKMNIKNKNSE